MGLLDGARDTVGGPDGDQADTGLIGNIVPDWVRGITDGGADALTKLAGLGGGGAAVLVAFAEDPEGFFIGLINEVLILPVLDAFAGAMAAVYDSLLWVAFGTDRMVGVYPDPLGDDPATTAEHGAEAGLGVLDVPLWFADAVIGLLAYSVGDPVLGFVEQMNAQFVLIASELGVAGPFVLPALWTLELAAAVYVIIYVAKSIDIPGFDQGPTIDALAAPGRKLLAWIRS